MLHDRVPPSCPRGLRPEARLNACARPAGPHASWTCPKGIHASKAWPTGFNASDAWTTGFNASGAWPAGFHTSDTWTPGRYAPDAWTAGLLAPGAGADDLHAPDARAAWGLAGSAPGRQRLAYGARPIAAYGVGVWPGRRTGCGGGEGAGRDGGWSAYSEPGPPPRDPAGRPSCLGSGGPKAPPAEKNFSGVPGTPQWRK
jgi:hypothetical protein